MRPLIPRVRVGDILKGTRNLRNWLQTASVLNYLQFVCEDYMSMSKARDQLYTPSKEDDFIVAVNAWNTFGAYGLNKDVVLLFHNSPPQSERQLRPMSPSASVLPPPRKSRNARKRQQSVGPYHPRMNPTIFSQWFIRTPGKLLDLNSWPQYALFMWACLHLNMCSAQMDRQRRTGEGNLVFHVQSGYSGPFTMHTNGQNWQTPALLQFIQEWAPRGITRAKAYSHYGVLNAFGPHLSEISSMKKEIRGLCANPRIQARIKQDRGREWPAFSQAYLANE